MSIGASARTLMASARVNALQTSLFQASRNNVKPLYGVASTKLHLENKPNFHTSIFRSLASQAAASSAENGENTLTLTDRGADRLAWLRKQQNTEKLKLRLSVEGGGCSGFQYKFETTTAEPSEEDYVFENKGELLLVDQTSMELVKGAKVDFTEDLIRRSFEVLDNPNAEQGCGCGASFAAKLEF